MVIRGKRGELKQRGANDDRDEFDGYGHDRPFVDDRLQVSVVDEQDRDSNARHNYSGQVHVADTATDVVVGEHYLEKAVMAVDFDAQQLFHLGRHHVYGRAGRETADQRLGQYRAHDAQPKHVHKYLH